MYFKHVIPKCLPTHPAILLESEGSLNSSSTFPFGTSNGTVRDIVIRIQSSRDVEYEDDIRLASIIRDVRRSTEIQMRRICDVCRKSIHFRDTYAHKRCRHCSIAFDVCRACDLKHPTLSKCPPGWGCSV